MSEHPQVDPARVIADLRELHRRTSDIGGAQRLCWSETWRAAREFLSGRLAEIGVVPRLDAAGNLFAVLEGEREPALGLGSHVDSVPGGGWLDGALGVFAALGVLRAWAEAGRRPPRSLALIDWADEEGARFGRSLFGSSAFSGSLDPESLAGLEDSEGHPIESVLAENGVELARAAEARSGQAGLAAYLELHIEQGPVLEAEGLAIAAVSGCAGVERMRFEFTGQAAHAGTTPMTMRRDAGLAAFAAALAIEPLAAELEGVATTGELRLEPGIATAVAGRSVLSVDLRNPDPERLEQMLGRARGEARRVAGERGCELAEHRVWRIAPTAFDPRLVELAVTAVRDTRGTERVLASGALHDAAELARVVPATMIFCASKGGLSHAAAEDTAETDLSAGIEAFTRLAGRALDVI